MSPTPDRTLADPQQIIADLQRELTQSNAERDEGLRREAATAEILQVISSSPGDLKRVFDVILQKAHALCDAPLGSLVIADGARLRWLATRGYPAEYEKLLRRGLPVQGFLPFEQLLNGERLVHLTDASTLPLPSTRRAALETSGIRTSLFVPLRKDGRPFGYISAQRQEVRPFLDMEIALLESFAAQAVIAMENARLINDTREALDQQTATAEVLEVINSSPDDLAPVFGAMLEKALRLCEAAHGHMVAYDDGVFHRGAIRGDPSFVEFWTERTSIQAPKDTPLARIAEGERIVHLRDAMADAGYRNAAPYRQLINVGGIHTLLAIALRKEDALLGAILVYRKEVRPFSDKQIALLQGFAAQAVIAMENARLITETREALEQQTATAEVLGVINASPGDLALVFDAMLEKATRLCEAQTGHLLRYENGAFRRAASLGIPEEFDRLFPLDAPMPDAITRDSVVVRMLATRSVIHVHDLREDELYRAGAPAEVAAVDKASIRSALFVPLLKEGEVVGAFLMHRLDVRPFSDQQIALLQNFAAQAVIAMENARLITETREALEQQTATAEVLGVINSSPGELEPVFDTMLEKAIRLCEAAHGYFLTYDGEAFHPTAVRGKPGFEEFWRRGGPTRQGGPVRPSHPSNPLAQLAQGARLVHVADAREEEAYREVPEYRSVIDLGGIRTSLTIPLRKEGTLLGAVRVYRQEVRPFTDKQIALLENFAAQAVIAMENARLITETREALEQQTATAEVLGVINSSPGDLAPVFDAMLEKAVRLCEAHSGTMYVQDGDCFRAVALGGVSEEFAEFLRREVIPLGPDTLVGRVMRDRTPLHITDVTTEESYLRRIPLAVAAVELGGTRTALMMPLLKDESLLGIFQLRRQEVRPFTDKQIALVENFAAQAVIAMENARLISETREALEQQTATADVLGVINSSPGDLKPVFDAMLEKATRLCEAASGILWTYDGARFRAVAWHGVSDTLIASMRRRNEEVAVPTDSLAAIAGGAAVVRDDDLSKSRGAHRAFEQSGMRTGFLVALRKGDAVLGAIRIFRREARPFTDKQIALVENFAAQAVIAMENARLITETREALEQQTATSEVLQVINSSPGDLAPVFDAILEKAHSLCGIAFGSLQLYEGGKVRAVAVRGAADSLAELLRQPMAPAPGSLPMRLLGGERFVQIADIAAFADQHPGYPRAQASADHGLRTALYVPLRRDADFCGYITAFRQEVRPFSDKEIALLQNFAAQAVIAMENARLITETREALEQQTATAEVLGVINASPGDLAPVFDAMLEKATRLCEASYGQLATYDGEFFRFVAVHGYTPFVEQQAREPVPPSFGVTWSRLVSGEPVVHMPDVRDSDIYRSGHERARRFVEIGGGRSLLTVALRKDDVLLGALSIYRQEVRPFSDKQVALLQNFAAQAVIAMENARLITETREALEQQTATAEVLQVINSSPGDLAPVFDAILEKAHRVCGAPMGSLVLYDGERPRAVATRGYPSEYDAIAREGGPTQMYFPFAGLLRGERYVAVADVAALPPNPLRRAAVEIGGVRTALFVPLRKDGALLGYISFQRSEVLPFTEGQIGLLENFAAQAVIAMENARLLGELRQRTNDLQESLEYQTATSDVLKVISRSTFELQPVLDTLVETAARLCEADRGLIATQDGEVYRVVATFAVTPEFDAYLRGLTIVPNRESVTGRIVLERQVVHIEDLARDPEYAMSVSDFTQGAHTVLGVPLMREGQPIGAIVLARHRVEPFTPRQIELVRTFSDQAVIAMENARLLGELRQRTDEVGELNRGLEVRVAEQVDELGRVGRLKRFLAPQLAELIVSQGDEQILESHRREIVVVFCDLRGYTAFTETAEPEEVLDFLRQYHGALGPLVSQFEGTLDQFSGDGIMVFFNDPVPCPDPAERAVNMAVAMREAAGRLIATWRRRGRELGFGAGIAQGYATLGQIGFAERASYTAVGTVCNLASRLCAEAEDGQILIGQRVAVAVEQTTTLEEIGSLTLKGLTQPVVAYNVPLGAIQPALRVIEGGSPETV